jgi:DNA-binding response OmpR family regulator
MSTLRLDGDSAFTPPPHDVAEHFGEQSAPRRRRVLVVDDERLIADTVVQILNIHGYDAFGAYSADEAMKLAENFLPDFLLSDVMMPGTNGIDLAIAVQEMLPTVLVLLFSGQAGTSQLIEDRDLPFALEAKPVHPDKLIKRLENLGRRR